MSAFFHREWLRLLGVLVGYAVLMGTNPVRHSLLDGFRAMRRYRRLWAIPAALGLCYALFHACVTLFLFAVQPADLQPAFAWRFNWSIPPWSSSLAETHSLRDWLSVFFADPRWQALRAAGLEGLESLAGLFNNVVTTFPFSAVAAALLLVNWQNHHRTLFRALRKRFGRWGWAIHAGILACALSAILEPILLSPVLIYLNRVAPGFLLVRWGCLIDWFSNLFGYMFGVGVQVYLILLVYTWLRGLTWKPVHLMDMAIRRFSIVVKWAALVMGFTALLIDLPRIFALLFLFDDPLHIKHTFLYLDRVARPLLALLLIFFSSMQITLTFHSETLTKAFAHHWQFLRRFWWPLLWYLLIAGIHLFGLAFLHRWLLLGFGGDGTAAGLLLSSLFPLVAAVLAAWLLASWVSFYKRTETGRTQAPDWIAF